MSTRDILSDKLDPPLLEIEADLSDEELFREAMADVVPIPRPVASRFPRSRNGPDDDAGKTILPGDLMSEFLETQGEIELRDRGGYVEGGTAASNRKLLKKLRRGAFSVQEDLDLHGLNQAEARSELETFLREASQRGLSCVRIVHGKGRNSPNNESILRRKVPQWLSTRRNARHVVAFTSARECDGGSGAIYVLLRRGPEKARRNRTRR